MLASHCNYQMAAFSLINILQNIDVYTAMPSVSNKYNGNVHLGIRITRITL